MITAWWSAAGLQTENPVYAKSPGFHSVNIVRVLVTHWFVDKARVVIQPEIDFLITLIRHKPLMNVHTPWKESTRYHHQNVDSRDSLNSRYRPLKTAPKLLKTSA